jgi:predicted acylesterase/phospholipase RssA
MDISNKVFAVDQVLQGVIPVGDDQCRFDYKRLENTIKDVVKKKLHNEEATMADTGEGGQKVPTFVVATKGLHAEGPPTLFRSYQCEGHNASQCTIWEAGRATSAAPTLFKPIEIEIPRPGGTFVDGGLAYNNPAELALSEAQKIWTTTKRFSIVSIGTGRLKSIPIVELESISSESKESATRKRKRTEIKSQVLDWVPDAMTANQMIQTVARTPKGVMAVKKMAEVCVSLTTSSEPVHQRLLQLSQSSDPEKKFPYHRFNVERDMQDIGLEECHRMKEMMAHTAVYLEETEGVIKRNACVQDLMNPRTMECNQTYLISADCPSYQTVFHSLPKILHGIIPSKSTIHWSR